VSKKWWIGKGLLLIAKICGHPATKGYNIGGVRHNNFFPSTFIKDSSFIFHVANMLLQKRLFNVTEYHQMASLGILTNFTVAELVGIDTAGS